MIKKNSNKLGIEGNFLNLIKIIYKKPIANIIVIGEKPGVFPLISGTRKGRPLSSLLFNVILYILANVSEIRKGNKRCTNWERRNKTVFV